jgi:transposase
VNNKVTRCYRYALAPSRVQAEAFARAAVRARRYWNALVAAQRYAEREIRAGRGGTIVRRLTELLEGKELTGRAVSVARQRAAQVGITADEAIRLLRTEKAAELGRMVKSKDGRALRWIGRRRLAVEYALEIVERTRKTKGSILEAGLAYALLKKFRECCALYILGKRVRPKFKRSRDSVSLQAQILKTTPTPLAETHVNLGRIAGPLVNHVRVVLHRPLPPAAHIKQVCLTCRNGRYYVVFMIDFEPEPAGVTVTGRVAGIDPGRKLALAVASLDGEDEEVFQPPLGRDRRWLRRLRRLQRKADRQRRTNNPDCYDREGRWNPGRRLAIYSKAQAAVERAIARMHEHQAAARLDYYHRTANELLERYDVIGIGGWRGTGRAPGRGNIRRAQNRKDYDHAISLFEQIVRYKAAENNRLVFVVNETGSTRNCENCGETTGPRGLSGLKVREWACSRCGHEQHRDFAAARAHARKAAEMAAGAFPVQPASETHGAKSGSAPRAEATKVIPGIGIKIPVADQAATVRSATHISSRGASAAALVQSLRAVRGSGEAVAQRDSSVCLRGHSGRPGSTGRPLAPGTMISDGPGPYYDGLATGELVEWENDYSYGVSDEIKNLYWTQRRLQEPGYDSQRPPLQRKYVTVWVPEQKQPDGTVMEGHYKVVEVVE